MMQHVPSLIRASFDPLKERNIREGCIAPRFRQILTRRESGLPLFSKNKQGVGFPFSCSVGRALNVRVEGQLVFNGAGALLNAALKGLGLTYLTQDRVQPYVSTGELVRVLSDWCPPFSGYHLYYPSRRQPSPAFSLLVDALRYRT
jgi:DNA-binding transcriptional LysR family regulator